jgi:PKD repeat protein
MTTKFLFFSALIPLVFQFGQAQNAPVAGFTLDSVITSNAATGFLIFFSDTSSGNPTTTSFIIHDPGDITFQYQVYPNGTFNNFLNFTNHPGPTICGPFEISQIVTNSFGSDTASVIQNIGCSCLSTPLSYWLNYTYSGNGSISFNAGTNEDSWDCLIYAQGMGSLLGCPSSGFWCTSTLPGPGTYTFCARFDNGTCTSNSPASTCSTVVISCAGSPQVSISHTSQQNTAAFSSQVSSWPGASYNWDFGDGNNSTLQNPSHTYAALGTYIACLTVSDTCGISTTCDSVVITCPLPIAGFSNSTSQLQASFTNLSTGNSPTFTWDFGDGNSSTLPNPVHTYSNSGTYLVCLTTTDVCGASTFCDSVMIVCPAPVAGFLSSVSLLTATFTNQSSGTNPQTYAWDFGDGNSSTLANPVHSYSSSGSFLICLTVTDLCGTAVYCDSLTANCPQPQAQFTSVQQGGLAIFSNTSTGLQSAMYFWNFGDGNTSTVQNPTHTYSTGGSYLACLTVTDSCGQNTVCDTVVVTVVGNEDEKSMAFSVYPNPVDGQLVLDFGMRSEHEGKIEMFDIRGKLVVLKSVGIGQSIVRLDVSGIVDGVYLLETVFGGLRIRHRILVSHR